MTGTGTAFGETLRKLAEEDPDSASLTCGDVTLTRRELFERSLRVAGRLSDLGVTKGSMVTISLPNSVEIAETMLATWWLGATPQPISYRLSSPERRAIVDLADPDLAVGVSETESSSRPTFSFEALQEAAETASPAPGPAVISPIWKAVTSGGSTGRPKLIVADHPAITESIIPLGDLLRLPDGGSLLVTAPMSHNSPVVLLLSGLLRGSHVILMRRFDAEEALRLVEKHSVDWLYLVPTMMLRIWRLPEATRDSFDVSSLQVVFHMAAPCPRWLKHAWIGWLGADRILELYGGTELQAMTVINGKEWLDRPGSVGKPVLGEIECRDPDGKLQPPGVEGELWMRRGPDQPRPYRYVGATARSDDNGWDSLGDHGYIDADGYVYITDREADMILVGGGNVYPAEVESALDEHPSVLSCCVIGLPDEDLGNVPHAIVELSEQVEDSELLAFLSVRLAPYKVPRTFERTSAPLRDDAGKVRRSALRAERIARLQADFQ